MIATTLTCAPLTSGYRPLRPTLPDNALPEPGCVKLLLSQKCRLQRAAKLGVAMKLGVPIRQKPFVKVVSSNTWRQQLVSLSGPLYLWVEMMF